MADHEPTFDTGLDRSATLTQVESERLAKWYSEHHGTGDLSLVGFVPLLTENRPEILKRHRFVAEAKVRAQKLGQLGNIMLFLHQYTIIANAKGILYEIIAARKAGATKAEVMDVISLAYVNGGAMNGLNAVAELSRPYLLAWQGDDREVASPWPDGWAHDPSAVTFADDDPAYARLLREHRPEVLREWRAVQNAAVTALPKQFPPLCLLHNAIIKGDQGGIRYAAAGAKAAGVSVDVFIDVITWAMSYSGELGLRATGELLLELTRGWSRAG